MCVYSFIADQWTRPGPNQIPGYQPWLPLPSSVDSNLARDMLEILKRLDKIDKKLNAKDRLLNADEKKHFEGQLRDRCELKHCECDKALM